MESRMTEIRLDRSQDRYGLQDTVGVSARFSIQGGLRDSFNEENWTQAYEKNDVSFKLKYGVKLISGGFRRRELGRTIDTYRKASVFWTRNPKLVNPMQKKRVWVQVAKNFEPFIRLTEDEVKQELFDFDEKFAFKASDLGPGTHEVRAEAHASWQKHHYTDPGRIGGGSPSIEIVIG